MTVVEVRHLQVAGTTPEGVVTGADALLAALEIGQHIEIAPSAVAGLRPAVEIHALAAVVDVAVDGARATERLAARHCDGASTDAGAGLGLIEPVDGRVGQRLEETRGDVDVGMPVGRARLEEADAVAPVGGQAVGQDATGRARTDDDVVEGVRHDATPARIAQRPELRVMMSHAGAWHASGAPLTCLGNPALPRRQ